MTGARIQGRKAGRGAREARWRSYLLALGAVLLASGSIADEVSESDRSARWTPSVSLAMLAHVQDLSGLGESTFPERDSFDPRVGDESLAVIPAVPVGLRVLAPEIELLGSPLRPFLHARLQVPFDQDRTVLRQGTVPNPVVIPPDLGQNQTAASISGQGTILEATIDLMGQVGLGLAYDTEVLLTPITASLSLDYVVQEMSLDGNVVYVTGEGPNETAPFTVQDLQALEGDVFHYLGPRVELETIAARPGPFDIAVFAEFGAFFTVGDDSTSFVIRDATDEARFDFEVDNWLIQAGVGVRLTWRGE